MPEYCKDMKKCGIYYKNYKLPPSAFQHVSQWENKCCNSLQNSSFGNEIITSYVTLEYFNGAKVICTPFLPFKIIILASHKLIAAKTSIVDTEL